jgi:hypothetical protein
MSSSRDSALFYQQRKDRMIHKLISSGQTGVELAALDVAIKLGIDHGGWVARGKRNSQGPLSDVYHLSEVPALGFKTAMEQNVMSADGTLLVTRGKKSPRTQYAVEMSLKHKRQLLHVDLSQNSSFEAASLISSWGSLQHIRIAFVTGPQAETDPHIYEHMLKIMETAFYLGFVKTGMHPTSTDREPELFAGQPEGYPYSVEEAVARLKSVLTLKDRAHLANIQAGELDHMRTGLSEYIKQKFGLYAGNAPLMKSCANIGKRENPLVEEACAIILRALWKDLQQTHKLRVVK